MALEKTSEDIQIQVRDNANGIRNLTDDAASGKNNVKGQMKILKEQIETMSEDVNLRSLN